DHLDATVSDLFEELPELGTVSYLLTTSAPFVIFIENRSRPLPPLTFLTNSTFLRIDTEVLLLHMARTPDIASDDERSIQRSSEFTLVLSELRTQKPIKVLWNVDSNSFLL